MAEIVNLESSCPILGGEEQPLLSSANCTIWKCRPSDSIYSECEKESLSSKCNVKASNF